MTRVLAGALFVVVAIVAALAVAVLFGTRRWERDTQRAEQALVAAGDSAGRSGASDAGAARYSPEMLDELPPPVQRYFRLVLTPDQPLVARAWLRHAGDFALRPNEWRPFTSRQLFATRAPAFVWDATIRMFPLFPVRVRDSYRAGRGSMLGAVAGVVKMVDQSGTPGMASGALLRYLAEAAWLPTALLPSAGVRWTAIDDSTARATLTDAGVAVSMDVHFAPGGEMSRITATRERDVNGTSVPTPWEAQHSSELLTVEGMKIPASGEVAWLLPEGRHTYWRGRVTEARYEYMR